MFFSHLFFADDLFLFSEASEQSCSTIHNVFMNFCNISGQKVNMEKSKIFFSPNTSSQTQELLSDILGIPLTLDLGSYLGFPLHRKMNNRESLNFILAKVRGKLAGWKTSCLSLAARHWSKTPSPLFRPTTCNVLCFLPP